MYIYINTYFLSKYCFHHYSMNTHNCWFHCCIYMYLPMEVNRNRKVFTGTYIYIYIYDHCLWVYTVIYWTLLNPQKLMSRNINETTVCSWYKYFLLWLTSNISWRLILIKEGLPLAHLQFSLGAEESFYKTVHTHCLKSKLYNCIIRTFEPLKAAIFHSWSVTVVYFYRDGIIPVHFNNYHYSYLWFCWKSYLEAQINFSI